jgi:hypothetical protein
MVWLRDVEYANMNFIYGSFMEIHKLPSTEVFGMLGLHHKLRKNGTSMPLSPAEIGLGRTQCEN